MLPVKDFTKCSKSTVIVGIRRNGDTMSEVVFPAEFKTAPLKLLEPLNNSGLSWQCFIASIYNPLHTHDISKVGDPAICFDKEPMTWVRLENVELSTWRDTVADFHQEFITLLRKFIEASYKHRQFKLLCKDPNSRKHQGVVTPEDTAWRDHFGRLKRKLRRELIAFYPEGSKVVHHCIKMYNRGTLRSLRPNM